MSWLRMIGGVPLLPLNAFVALTWTTLQLLQFQISLYLLNNISVTERRFLALPCKLRSLQTHTSDTLGSQGFLEYQFHFN